MPGHIPKRLRDQGKKRRRATINVHVEEGATAVVADDSSVNMINTVNSPAERATFADDVMPAMLTTLPVLFVILLLALSDQTVLLRSIVQEGNPLGLAILFIPLFAPSIVASFVYFAKARGWIQLSVRWTNILALVPAGFIGLFVPLNYLGLQISVFVVSLIWLRMRHRRMRWRVTLLAVAIAVSLLGLGTMAQWKWDRINYFPRVAVGRIVAGFTAMNVDDRPGGRSVLVISVNDAYAIVALRGYPPKVENISLETLQKGRICQSQPRWNQVSLIRHWTDDVDELANSTEVCIDR